MQVTSFQFKGELTPEQRRFLDEQGFIKFERFLSDDEVRFVWGEIEKVQAGWIAEGRSKAYGIPIKYGKDLDGRPFVNRFAFTTMYSRPLHEFITSERFQQIATILGPEFRFG